MIKSIFLISGGKVIGSPVLGIVIPGVVFLVSIIATLLLYRHFSKRS
jgi:hypothetical protein